MAQQTPSPGEPELYQASSKRVIQLPTRYHALCKTTSSVIEVREGRAWQLFLVPVLELGPNKEHCLSFWGYLLPRGLLNRVHDGRMGVVLKLEHTLAVTQVRAAHLATPAAHASTPHDHLWETKGCKHYMWTRSGWDELRAHLMGGGFMLGLYSTSLDIDASTRAWANLGRRLQPLPVQCMQREARVPLAHRHLQTLHAAHGIGGPAPRRAGRRIGYQLADAEDTWRGDVRGEGGTSI